MARRENGPNFFCGFLASFLKLGDTHHRMVLSFAKMFAEKHMELILAEFRNIGENAVFVSRAIPYYIRAKPRTHIS